jgi:Ferritin-like
MSDSGIAHVERVRGGHEGAEREGEIHLEHREALIYTLGKAAELEHLVMCQYLYAAFSLKETEAEGVPADLLPTVKRWKKELLEIGAQEMLHLALVQNLLAAVGAAPRLARPNLPLPPRAYPAGVQIALVPFGEAALRHFAYLERPEGMHMDDAEEFAALEKAVELPRLEEDEIGPRLQEFSTIGHLYRSIQAGIAGLAETLGEDRLFIGPPKAQATEEHFRWEELVAVHDVASAHAAIETIVEQGEGARGDWKDAHFGRLIRMLDEFMELSAANPDFEPTRPVLLAHVREPASGADVVLIEDPFTARLADLLNATYEVVLQLLSRYFANAGETPAQLEVLADVAVTLMFSAIKPLGGIVARLQIGPAYPGRTAGPALELFYDVDYLLPHRDAAWTIMTERLIEIADLATRCRDACIPSFMPHVARVTDALRAQAERLAAAADAG